MMGTTSSGTLIVLFGMYVFYIRQRIFADVASEHDPAGA